MPTPQEIAKKTSRLPRISLKKESRDGETWKEKEGGARFEVTRHFMVNLPEFFLVSISGSTRSRQRIARDFQAAWGKPLAEEEAEGKYLGLWPVNGRR